MPASVPSNGRAFIWFITCFLFICIVAGGGCLAAYMLLPEAEVASWLPIVGVTLVCLPWAFWILTFLYRVLSRAFGFRVRFGHEGGGRGRGVGDAANAMNSSANVDVEDGGAQAYGEGEVQFGEAVAVRQQDGHGGLQRTSSVASHESQMPLAKSMSRSS